MLTKNDLTQIEKKGINPETIEKQLSYFKAGFPFLDIIRPAIIANGIIRLEKEHIDEFLKIYNENVEVKKLMKFVPASGAASRMFKSLFDFVELKDAKKIKSQEDFINEGYTSIYNLIQKLPELAFYEDLKNKMADKGLNIQEDLKNNDFVRIINFIITSKGLNYGNLPKGLLKFHTYSDRKRSALEEHFVEGANYSSTCGEVNLHFTVSPEHRSSFEHYIRDIQDYYEKIFSIKYNVSLSEQKPSTDTIAVDKNNEPLREKDGTFVFRPGGHGALIENLNDLDADIVFIKNIDNVVLDKFKEPTYIYKKVLTGILIEYQQRVFNYLLQLSSQSGVSDSLVEEIGEFIQDELCIIPPEKFVPKSKAERISYLQRKLNRPIRVCGMVRNLGEPGGGPFWATNPDGTVSLQIAESSQIDPDDQEKQEIVEGSTHFNPVDLVCGIKGFNGSKFDLKNFVDNNTGFISIKSKGGKELKALELPGLWNGAMSDWITIFVEVPIETFNPVKTIFDLLKKEHNG